MRFTVGLCEVVAILVAVMVAGLTYKIRYTGLQDNSAWMHTVEMITVMGYISKVYPVMMFLSN